MRIVLLGRRKDAFDVLKYNNKPLILTVFLLCSSASQLVKLQQITIMTDNDIREFNPCTLIKLVGIHAFKAKQLRSLLKIKHKQQKQKPVRSSHCG